MVLQEEFLPCCAAMGHEIDVVRVVTKRNNNTLALTHLHTQKAGRSHFDVRTLMTKKKSSFIEM